MSRLDRYFEAETLRDAAVVVSADSLVCGNCLEVAQLATYKGKDKRLICVPYRNPPTHAELGMETYPANGTDCMLKLNLTYHNDARSPSKNN
jgi:hypothetical protein